MYTGFKVLLEGPTGTGKTYALRTLIECGITPFIIATEPGTMATLGDLPKGSFHLHYVKPAKVAWSLLRENAKKINTMSYEMLCKQTDMNKKHYGQFLELLDCFANYTCDLDGKEYGCVDDWQTDRCVCVDSLSGINIMAMDLAVGAKPVKSPGDWGVAMDNLLRLITNLCVGIDTHVVLTAHLSREKDEVSGGIKLMTDTLGQKLAPKVPIFFDDVIETKRKGAEFFWSTASVNTDTKSRHLPIQPDMIPNFKPIYLDWVKKGGKIEKTL